MLAKENSRLSRKYIIHIEDTEIFCSPNCCLGRLVPQLQSGNDLFFQNSFGPPKFLLVLYMMVVSSKDMGSKLPSTTSTTPPVAAPFQVQAQAPLHRWWQRFILVSWERGGLGGLNRNSTEAAQT